MRDCVILINDRLVSLSHTTAMGEQDIPGLVVPDKGTISSFQTVVNQVSHWLKDIAVSSADIQEILAKFAPFEQDVFTILTRSGVNWGYFWKLASFGRAPANMQCRVCSRQSHIHFLYSWDCAWIIEPWIVRCCEIDTLHLLQETSSRPLGAANCFPRLTCIQAFTSSRYGLRIVIRQPSQRHLDYMNSWVHHLGSPIHQDVFNASWITYFASKLQMAQW